MSRGWSLESQRTVKSLDKDSGSKIPKSSSKPRPTKSISQMSLAEFNATYDNIDEGLVRR